MLSFWNREAIEVEVVNMLQDHFGHVAYPVDIDFLISKMGIELLPYSEDHRDWKRHISLNASSDAFTLCTPDFEYASIRFNTEAYSETRIKFSKAHELGHIYLEHLDVNDARAESEADYFAGYLLAPHPLIGHYSLESSISKTFDIGSWCADIAQRQYFDRCKMGGPLKEHEERLLSIARIHVGGGEYLGPEK